MCSAIDFKNPNDLEAVLYGYSYIFAKKFLMCYKISVAFCNPINRVQSVANNRYGGMVEFSADALLKLFELGHRIDIMKYSGIIVSSPHEEMELYLKDDK